ncbi:MAG: hypothetical protein ACPG80_00690, partial [Rickettsiales bacterium]
NGAFVQSDFNAIDLHFGTRDANVSLTSLSGDESLFIKGDGSDVVLGNSGNGIFVGLDGPGVNLTFQSGVSSTHEFYTFEGDHTIDASNTNGGQDFVFGNGGTHNLTLGGGTNEVIVSGGSTFVDASGSSENNYYFFYEGADHTISGGFGSETFDIISTADSSIMGGDGNDTFILEDTSGTTVDGGNGNNIYEVEGFSTNANAGLSITGGDGQDIFKIEGEGPASWADRMILDGGTVSANSDNVFEFYDFNGTAEMTLNTDNSSYADRLHFHGLGSESYIEIEGFIGSATNAWLEILEPFGAGGISMTSANGSDVEITTQSGGRILLGDFFLGDNEYDLVTSYHGDFAKIKGLPMNYVRDLSAPQYDIKLVQGILSVADNNFVDGDTFDINGQTFTMVDAAPGAYEIQIGTDEADTANNLYSVLSGISEFTVSPPSGNEIHFSYDITGWVDFVFATNFTGGMIDLLDTEGLPTGHLEAYNFQQLGDVSTLTSITTMLESVTKGSIYDDYIKTGGIGNQTLYGNDGHDILVADGNFDTLLGGSGHDTVILSSSANGASLDGGAGYDTLDLSENSNAITFDLENSTTVSGDGGTSSVVGGSFEAIITGAGADYLTGSNNTGARNFFDGGAGNDTITGGTGTDVINTVSYEWATTDLTITLIGGVTTLAGGTATEVGADELSNIQNIIGGSGNDTISTISSGLTPSIIYGMAGNDILSDNGDMEDIFIGGAGDDTIDLLDGGNSGRDIVSFEFDSSIVGDLLSSIGTDTVNNFDVSAIYADAFDLSYLKHEAELRDYNYFDLVREGYLSQTGGANTDIFFDGTHIATVNGIASGTLDWKNFILDHNSVYEHNGDGGVGSDVIVISGSAPTHYGYEGNDIMDLSAATSGIFHGGDGDDSFVINTIPNLTGSVTMYGENGYDTLVLDFSAISAPGTADIDFGGSPVPSNTFFGIEIIDLFGSEVANLGVDDAVNLTFDMTTNNSLIINDSSADASGVLNLDAGSNWQHLTSGALTT